MTSRTHTATFIIVMSVLVACGDDATTDAGPDGSLADGAVDAGGFDPTMEYPGEGDACEFSVLCGDNQLCVDGMCSRHERFEVDELTRGEWRVLGGDAMRASPFYTEAEVDWDTMRPTQPGLHAGMVPGPDGPVQLFYLEEPSVCQVAVVGARVRVLTARGMICTAVTATKDGRVLLAGYGADRQPRLVLFDANDEVIADTNYTDEFTASLGLARDFGAGAPTSFLQDGDGFLMSFDVADFSRLEQLEPERRQWYSVRVGFARISPTLELEPLPVNGRAVHDGGRGWLLRSAAHGVEALLAEVSDPEEFCPNDPFPMNLLSLEDGALRALPGTWRCEATYAQPTADRWELLAFHDNLDDYCQYLVIDADFQRLERPMIRRCAPRTTLLGAGFSTLGRVNQSPFALSGGEPRAVTVLRERDPLPGKLIVDNFPATEQFDLPPESFVPAGDIRVELPWTTLAISRFGKSFEVMINMPPGAVPLTRLTLAEHVLVSSGGE